jgi:alpha-amylase/alpha-mannosidase (GH57 family)
MSSIVVHGHFYQPPRENPWTQEIDHQPSAAPFHDWNERVHAESYRPNSLANIITPTGERTVSNYERMSFDIGPTLFSWLEKVHPKTYGRILHADRSSRVRLGHGNALAQAFHHTILPLSAPHDVRTEVRWGLADFRYRFGREAEGLWLPETAASRAVLDILVDEGVTFTILAPWQAARVKDSGHQWTDVSRHGIDTRRAYRYRHTDASGRSLALFFYDADIARAIAFERATSSAERLMDLFASRAEDGAVVHAATDGETYGHHHIFGDIGLAYALYVESARRGIEPINYATHLERRPPEHEVEIVAGEGTSWSCAHGVGRWKGDCGCHTGGEPGWDQKWRAPLRSALEVVKRAADDAFERAGSPLLADPWAARDAYVDVVIGARTHDDLIVEHATGPLDDSGVRSAARLLELQRNAMAMFTSCAWFFSDVSGIETVQILRYAARALDLLEEAGRPAPRREFLAELERAKSNRPDAGTAADIFESLARWTTGT